MCVRKKCQAKANGFSQRSHHRKDSLSVRTDSIPKYYLCSAHANASDSWIGANSIASRSVPGRDGWTLRWSLARAVHWRRLIGRRVDSGQEQRHDGEFVAPVNLAHLLRPLPPLQSSPPNFITCTTFWTVKAVAPDRTPPEHPQRAFR
jgi:hypothetical protein